MSGLRGVLDDAYELAEKLREELRSAYDAACDEPRSMLHQDLEDWVEDIDGLANQIDQQRTLLRS